MHPAIQVHPTRSCEDILHIVECIYAAACGEMPWEKTLAAMCEIAQLKGCALSMVEPLEQRRLVLASWGLPLVAEPGAVLGLISRGDPQLRDRVLRSAPGAVWQDLPAKSDALAASPPFSADSMRSDGLGSSALVIVGSDGRKVVCLETFAAAERGSSRPELGNLLSQLAPHLTRAWRVCRTPATTLATSRRAASPSCSHTDLPPGTDLAGLPAAVRLRMEFGLTKAEARLALRLAEGASLASAAEAFNVKLTTVRSQLQQVFAKTGASRQTELVAMLLSHGYGFRRPSKSPYRFSPAEAEVAGSTGAGYGHAMGTPDRC